ncbi:PKD domain-containing protein, partial [Candidatus Woesearchaeota archaeon]|nr:PKD domain-containing protein [Candidatus Woesearchaeota archaeon]
LINWTYAGNSNVLVIIDENNTVTFSAVADWNGIETITFTAADPFGLNGSDDVIVTVNAVNDAPVAYDVVDNVDEDTEIIVTLNHSDVDAGDQAETCIISNLIGGTETTACACAGGVCTVGLTTLANSTVDVTADYIVNDGDVDSNIASITVTVNPVDDAPDVLDIPDVSFDEDTSDNSIDLDDYITEVDGDAINWSYAGNTDVVVAINGSNVVTFTATQDWNGVETITFTATDDTLSALSDSDDVIVTVNAVNDAPVAYDVVDGGDEDVEVIVTLNYTDVEGDSATSCTIVGAVVGGTETTSCACAGGVCTVGLTSLSNSSADITANYTVNDGILDSNIASITVNLNAVNDAPYFNPALVDQSIDEGFTLIYDINASDADPNDILSFSSNITLLGGAIDNNGILTFPTNNNLKGSHLVEVTVCDDSGAVNNCTSDTFTVTVNDIPIVASTTGPYIGYEGSAVNFSGFAAGGSVPYYYIWDFDNDGTWDTAWSLTPDISNTWNDDFFSGTALLLVNDSIGELANATTSITILNVAPTANAGGPYYCMDGDSITLDGSATDPAGVNDVLNYSWDLDNDGIYETNIEDPTYTCDVNLSAVNLSVNDEDGGLDIATATINVVSGLAAYAQGPYVGNEGSAVVFNGAAAGGYQPYSYRWDLDGDGTWDTPWNSINTISNTWPDDYTGTVALQVNDSVGHLANDTTTVTILNVAPTANAGGPYICTMGENITLTGSATDPGNDTISYAWDLDDDGVYEITGANANFSCINYGLYPVNFSASDEDGGVGIASTYVFVGAQNITLDANGPYSGTEGSLIVFNGLVTGGLFPYQFRWDFDNDGTWDTAWSSTPDASYAYPDDYNDVAVLQVNDSLGVIAIAASNVTITNAAPTANADGPYSCIIGQNITLAGSATDPGTGDVLTYDWDLDNDSTYETPGQSVIFACSANGTYQVNLMVSDDDGGVAYDSSSVLVSVPTLLVDANGPYMGEEGFAINTFSGSASGGIAPYQYRWDFNNDGTYDTVWASTADASTTYNDDYSGVAVLEVMDAVGATSTDTASVTVNNIAPTAEANGPYSCNEGQVITLTGSATDPGSDILTFDWDLNDDAIYETAGQYPAYTCGTVGTYNVGLRVTDDDSGSSTDTAVISVGLAPDIIPPIVVINSPQPIVYTVTNLTIDITASDASGISHIWYTINNGAPIDYYAPINQIFGDNAAYTLTAYASDMIGNVGSASVSFIVNSTYGIISLVEEPKPRYIIKLDRIRMSDDGFINIGDDLRTTISLSNIGDKDLEDARISVVIPELGIWKRVGPLDLDKGDRETREIVLDMPDDVAPGEYIARIVVSNSKTRRVVHRPIIIE